MSLTTELAATKERMKEFALEYGLDFFETFFEVLDFDQLNEVASFGGFPNRYPHWRFGMQYDEMMKGYSWGLSKIYELVINNDPCYAYLMRSNSMLDQKLVIAHVYGHSDFFKNNMWFAGTNRKMMDQMANHGTRVRKMIDRYGLEKVETFLDACLSLENLIDAHSVAIRRNRPVTEEEIEQDEIEAPARARKLKSKDYMDRYINPPEYLEAQRKKLREEVEKKKRFPPEPVRDVLLFLIENAPVTRWERELLTMIREEAYYFAPQAMTKIMNEGWACVTGDTLVPTDTGFLPMREIVERRLRTRVSDGASLRPIEDHAVFRDRETVRIRTARGFELEGSTTHRVRLEDGTFRRLDELAVGDRVELAVGAEVWARAAVAVAVGARDVRGGADPAAPEDAAGGGDVLLRLPRDAVCRRLSGWFDANATVGPAGVVAALDDDRAAGVLQLLLLNLGMLSRRRKARDDRWRLHVTGASARRFREVVGFRRDAPREALDDYVGRCADGTEDAADAVVSIERGRADVYDVTVGETHRYVAGGLVNHNSYWHSKIMTEKALSDAEVVDYADRHSGTLGTRPGRINPYKLGIELFRDIEDRWNRGKFGREWEEEEDYEKKRNWDTGAGVGREKIFEVRRIFNDVTFIDTFLTEEFAQAQKLFVYRTNPHTGRPEIADRDWTKVKNELLFMLTNRGQPIIEVLDGNYRNRGELYLIHRWEGVDLRLDYAQETLRNLHRVWRRPVHIESKVEGKGRRVSFDGEKTSVDEITATEG